MKKNDDIILEITAITGGGVGIGKADGMVVFVDQTAVGDTVKVHIIKVKKNYAIGKIMDIITPSADRGLIDCPAFSKCGGCAFRHINYKAELEVKYKAVKDAMQRIGGISIAPREIIPSPERTSYRNKAQYPITMSNNGIAYGFFAKHSHRVIESENCCLQPKVFDDIMQTVKLWADKYGITVYDEGSGTGLLRHVLLRLGETTEEIMVVPVINGDTLPFANELTELLKAKLGQRLCSLQFNINKDDTNVILGEKTQLIYGNEYIRDTICGVTVKISPKSFYQVNRKAAEVLYSKAASYIEKNDQVIIDLFCGIGSIGLSLLSICGKENRSLYGVEIVDAAVQNAKQNAIDGGFENVEFICDDATGAAERLNNRGIKPNVAIVDPPRKGCDERLLNTICFGFAPNKLIYISCDPSTLARDSKILSENRYILKEYSPIDLFPGTAHVETIALFLKATND